MGRRSKHLRKQRRQEARMNFLRDFRNTNMFECDVRSEGAAAHKQRAAKNIRDLLEILTREDALSYLTQQIVIKNKSNQKITM